ncbi:hypothetical protein [Paenibacillus apiarius]|uniref:hypothetical protein n=1 Tax=Paenibacillus apiarius TaxID=46240 RepID=UPI003B3A00D3
MGRGRTWSKEEVSYLEDVWGTVSIKGIAKKLNRTLTAVKVKAAKLSLGDARFMSDVITVNQLAVALQRERSILLNWEQKYNLPVRKKLFCSTARVAVVSYQDFWKWAEHHKELLNLAKLEENILGPEPGWAKTKRKADQQRSQKSKQAIDWTPEEDQQLLQVLETKNVTYPYLAKMFDRSEASIKRRLHDLGAKIRPVRLNNHIKYTQEEVQKLVRMAEEGHSFEAIGQALGKSALGVRGKLERIGFDFKRRKTKSIV